MRKLSLLALILLPVTVAASTATGPATIPFTPSMNVPCIATRLGLIVGPDSTYRVADGNLIVPDVTNAALKTAAAACSGTKGESFEKAQKQAHVTSLDDLTASELADALIAAGVITKDQLTTSLKSQRHL